MDSADYGGRWGQQGVLSVPSKGFFQLLEGMNPWARVLPPCRPLAGLPNGATVVWRLPCRRAHRADAGLRQGLPRDGAAAAGGRGHRECAGQLWRYRHVRPGRVRLLPPRSACHARHAAPALRSFTPHCNGQKYSGRFSNLQICDWPAWMSFGPLNCTALSDAGGRRASMGRTTAWTSCCSARAGGRQRRAAAASGCSGPHAITHLRHSRDC